MQSVSQNVMLVCECKKPRLYHWNRKNNSSLLAFWNISFKLTNWKQIVVAELIITSYCTAQSSDFLNITLKSNWSLKHANCIYDMKFPSFFWYKRYTFRNWKKVIILIKTKNFQRSSSHIFLKKMIQSNVTLILYMLMFVFLFIKKIFRLVNEWNS